MKNLKKRSPNYLLIFLTLILLSCSYGTGKGKLLIEEIEISTNDKPTTKSKFETKNKFEITFGSNFSYSSNSKSSSNEELKDISLSFNNKKLSDILNDLEHSYSTNKLIKNPLLKIVYHRENTTKEKAVKEIISQLEKTYNF